MKKFFWGISGLFLVGFLFFLFMFLWSVLPVFTKQTEVIPGRKVMLGAWTQGFYDPLEKKLQVEKLLDFENLIEKKVSIAHYYLGWESLVSPEVINQFEQIGKNGWQPMLNVNPYYFSECPASQVPLYKAIAEGICDEFIRKAAKNISFIDDPFFLVFAWEMNNWVNEWSISKTGSSNEDFISAWRHIHNIFRQEGADKVIWVFCPNIPEESISPYDKIYPGDEYVDWVGLDGYNWGTTQPWSEWVSFEGVFKGPYERITLIAPDKPLVIAEFNTTNEGGDKAYWYKDAFEKQIPENFPKIEAVIIFNEDRSDTEGVNWKVDINEESLKSFKEQVSSDIYH